MCYDDGAQPPAPPVTTGPATGHDLQLKSADGATFAAYLARPDSPAPARVVLLPDVNGLHDFYRELALRIAETGHTTLVIDYFGRTHGTGPRDDTFDRKVHLDKLTREQQLLDIRAAVEHLSADDPDAPIYTMGFCMGGGTSLYAGTTDLPLAGVIAFYAWTGGFGTNSALPDDFVTAIRCPVLGLFGDADSAVPTDVPRAFDEHLTSAGIPHDIVIYPGEPHGFFEMDHGGLEGHTDAAQDSWRRLLTFLA